MPKKSKSSSRGRTVGLALLVVAFAVTAVALLLHGNNVALLNSKGMIAHEQRNLMYLVVGIMLIIAIPAVFLFFHTAWKYRESNTKAKHDPESRHNRFLVLYIWLVPTTFAVVLSVIMWSATHRLAPQKSIEVVGAKPLTIQVVGMRWKWLFIYPEQHVATVNFVQIPVDTPVTFELTADEAPMSSFWIPNLGGQLYAMTGMVNRLNLMATTVGDYTGSSAEINGAGFADMKFTTRVSPKGAFDFWLQSLAQDSPHVLNAAEYAQLLKPSEDNKTTLYSSVDTGLYDTVLMKYMGPMGSMEHGAIHE